MVDCGASLLATLAVAKVRLARRRTHCRGDCPKQTVDAITEDDGIEDPEVFHRFKTSKIKTPNMPSRATGSSSQAPYDPAKLSTYSYAELRAHCKSAGVSAGGKTADLRARLAHVHAGSDTSDARAATRRAPSADDMAAKALSTPLPSRQTTLPRIKTRVEGRVDAQARLARSSTNPPGSWLLSAVFKLLKLLKLLPLLSVALYALDAHLCGMKAFTDLGWTADASCEAASRAAHEASSFVSRVIEMSPVDLRALDLKNMLIKGVEDAHASLLDRIEGKTKVPFEPLNRAVLGMLVTYNADLGSVVSHLEDVWSGRHVSSDDKSNAVVFACLDSRDCAEVEADISAVADATSVLKVLVDEGTSRGEVQAQIATFLSETPNGVVVVPRVERWSPALLSVLNNCMGEGGSLMQDGVAVPTNSATWLLTARADVTPDMTSNSVTLSLAVKRALMDGHDEADETAQAVLMAFRRRLDVVALGTPAFHSM